MGFWRESAKEEGYMLTCVGPHPLSVFVPDRMLREADREALEVACEDLEDGRAR